jgi:hypothetical protein
MRSKTDHLLGRRKLEKIISNGLFHCTTVDFYRAIRSDGFIKPNLGHRQHRQAATLTSRCFRLGMISLFDARADPRCSWLKICLTMNKPITIAIKLIRQALRGRIVSCEEARKLTSGLTLRGEVCCRGEISVQCITGFLLASTAHPSLFKRVAGNSLSDEAIKKFEEEIAQTFPGPWVAIKL